ncbi:MAG TPA: DUF4157 domain-containing protein [Blastocatellia bacterium]|nr:DUF4157 domain-containing protein [Blastocatellia bacterium]
MPASTAAAPHISRLTGPLKSNTATLQAGAGIEDSAVAPSLERSINSVRGGGMPLPAAARSFLEPRFGRDLSGVRIHTDQASANIARRLDSRAFTVGPDIFFAPGEFDTRTSSGLRVLSHELAHAVQQGAVPAPGLAQSQVPSFSSGAAGAVQREVNPKRIDSKNRVLDKTRRIAGEVANLGKGQDRPAEYNLKRLIKLGYGFNPGADIEEKNNSFVYTCKCGWIDMGHFFISAAVAYLAAYLESKGELKIQGVPYTLAQVLDMGVEKARPFLRLLLKTVATGDQGEKILADLDELLKSGEPRDVSLAFGYGMEFGQQVLKLIADPMKEPGPTLVGSQRSAFTMEDLPSDCYGADFGQDVWKRVGGAKLDESPIYAMLESFFSECGAVFPQGDTRCAMMAETSPGSCEVGKGKEPEGGEPLRYTSKVPYLLNSAEPLCGKAPEAKLCESATGGPRQLPGASFELSATGQNLTLEATLFDEFTLRQAQERGEFGGEFHIPGRTDRLEAKSPLVLSGPTRLRVNLRRNRLGANILGATSVKGVPGLPGSTRVAGYFSLPSGRFGIQAQGALDIDATGSVKVDFARLFDDLGGPEVKMIIKEVENIFAAEDMAGYLVKLVTSGRLKEMVDKVRSLLKERLPNTPKAILDRVLARLLDREKWALALSLNARGTVSILGLPTSYFTLRKGVGLSPLLGAELGLVTTELAEKRMLVGAKGWLYGEKLLQAQIIAGVDLFGHKGIVGLRATNESLTGEELNLNLRWEHSLSGEDVFAASVGGKF